MASPNLDLKIVFGAMTLGKPNTLGARVHAKEDAAKMLDTFQQHGHSEIDTARLYGAGSSEEMLADLAWQDRGIVMGTKLYPNYINPNMQGERYSHKPEDIRRGLTNSLRALKCDKIDLFYLHGPDRNTPFEETLREIDQLYREGLFNRWGVSNYYAWEVASMAEICRQNNWVQPSVYQGIYNVLHRNIESELLPCLRHYGISLYAFQPLAGGFLTGRYQRDQKEFERGSRFDPKQFQGSLHRGRYWSDSYFDALEMMSKAGEEHNLTLSQIALGWLKHHSGLEQRHGDAIIIGASSVEHLEQNLLDLEGDTLPEAVVQATEEAWRKVKATAPKYWH